MSQVTRWVVPILVSLLALRATCVAPFFLSHTNVLAVQPIQHYFSGSDLAWGQHLNALRTWCHQRAIDEPIGLMYCGSIDPAIYDIQWDTPHAVMEGGSEESAWIFVSRNLLRPPFEANGFTKTGAPQAITLPEFLREMRAVEDEDAPIGFAVFHRALQHGHSR